MPEKPDLKRIFNRTIEALLPLVGLLLALLIGAGMLLALEVNPLVAYSALIDGAVGGTSSITQTLVKATPLLLVGLGVVISYRGGVINIGGEGQLIVGALAATAAAPHAVDAPVGIARPLPPKVGITGAPNVPAAMWKLALEILRQQRDPALRLGGFRAGHAGG